MAAAAAAAAAAVAVTEVARSHSNGFCTVVAAAALVDVGPAIDCILFKFGLNIDCVEGSQLGGMRIELRCALGGSVEWYIVGMPIFSLIFI